MGSAITAFDDAGEDGTFAGTEIGAAGAMTSETAGRVANVTGKDAGGGGDVAGKGIVAAVTAGTVITVTPGAT